MTDHASIDLDVLLSPISEDTPQGKDQRSDRSPMSVYHKMKDARNQARAAERAALGYDDESGIDLLTPWQTVITFGQELLSSASKDLEVACWLTEGLIRLEGFQGLKDGFLIIHRLIQQYWEHLYPLPDEDGLETKVAPLTGLNGDGAEGTLLAPLRNSAITEDQGEGAFSFWQYQQAREASKIEDEETRAARFEALGFTFEQMENTIAACEEAWCISLVSAIEDSLSTFNALNTLLREHCHHDAPPCRNISSLLQEILRTTRFIYKEKLEVAVAVDESSANKDSHLAVNRRSDATVGKTNEISHSLAQGPISNREEALNRLEEVATFFRTYEPHTPIAPGIERLVNWGRMTVSELMIELLPDAQTRSIYSQLTGVKLDGSDESSYVIPPAMSSVSQSSQPFLQSERLVSEAVESTEEQQDTLTETDQPRW